MDRTDSKIDTPTARTSSRRVRRDVHEERRIREARALAIVKAIKRPSGAKPLSPTHLVGIDPDAPGVVYFAYCGGRIKIGYSTDVANRMATLATSSPMPVTLLLTIRGSEEDEHLYHEMFADDRAHLEWFRLSLDLRDFLSSKFEHGTHELMTNAEFECRDELAEEALSLS